MVAMENIERRGIIISMDCYEEGDRTRAHHVEFNAETLEITNGIQSNIYIRQGIAKIWKCLRAGTKLPRTLTSYWC